MMSGDKENGDDNVRRPASADCPPRAMARRTKKTSRAGERAHQTIRPRQRRTAPAADGQNRKELSVRKSRRRAITQGSIRGPPATGGLSLHVRSLMGERLPGLHRLCERYRRSRHAEQMRHHVLDVSPRTVYEAE